MATDYELVLLIDPELDEEARAGLVERVRELVTARGELLAEHDWGLRKLAYEIKHRPQAHYVLFEFRANDPAGVRDLPRELRIIEGLLRHRLVKLGHLSPDAPRPDQGLREREGGRRERRAARAA